MIKFLLRSIILLFISLTSSFALYAQSNETSRKIAAADTTRISFVDKMQAFAKASAKSSADEFNADKAAIIQNKVFEEIKKTIQRAKIYLRTGVDTVNTKAEMAMIEKDIAIAGDGVLTNKGTAQTFRNLTSTSKILTELLAKANARKVKMDLHQQELNNFRYQLDSLLSLPSLFKFPTDSVILSKYIQKIVVVAYEAHPVDSALKQANNNVQVLLNKVNMQVFKLQTNLEEIQLYQRNMAVNIFKREFDNLWSPAGYYRPFTEILAQAKAKGILTLLFYVQDNSVKIIVLVLLFIGCFAYLLSVKKIYKEQGLLTKDFEGQLVLRYPLLSALVIIINLFQFIFFSPPFIVNVIFWTISSISLTIMFKNFITRYWMNVWLIMVSLFLLTAFDNLILQASRSERWIMLTLSILGTVAGLLVILRGRKDEL
ncbi:MAG: mechanosensitive ion channel protein, partial [Sphingobacteriaceae bacterium]